MARVLLEKIYKSFPARDNPQIRSVASQSQVPMVSVLRGINLTVQDGEFMVLVGPSGCGKSTLLRVIAGLEELTGGNIHVDDRLVNSLPPKQRDMAMVFQSYALYPHLTVYENIAFGLRRMNQNREGGLQELGEGLLVGMTRSLPSPFRYLSDSEKAIAKQVRKVADLLQIEALLDRLPKQLSGGQKQRVALGRAIARNPKVFLMDEPLSNLDAKLRAETRTQIVQLQRELGTTTIYVTHDQTEAMTMGDRIAVLNQGEIQQIAPPLDLYNSPANLFVAEFIGSPPMNFLEVNVTSPLLISQGQFRFTLPDVWEKIIAPYHGRSLILGVRSEHFSLSPPAPKNFSVKIDLVEALGNDTYLTTHLADAPDVTFRIRIPPEQSVRPGNFVWIAMNPDKIHFFDPKTGKNIWYEV